MAGLPSSEPRSACKNYVPLWCGHSGGRRMTKTGMHRIVSLRTERMTGHVQHELVASFP